MGIFHAGEKGVGSEDALKSRGAERFGSSDCLLQAIESVLTTDMPATISNHYGRIRIDPHRRVFWQAIDDRKAFFRTPSRSAVISHRNSEPNGTPRPIDEVLWEAAYHGSSGALLDRHNPLAAVRLLRWPNLARISHTPAMIRLCALIHQRAVSMSVAIRLLHVPEQDAWRFFSAALASGVARESGCGENHSSPGTSALTGATRRVSSFWGQLFQRLAGA